LNSRSQSHTPVIILHVSSLIMMQLSSRIAISALLSAGRTRGPVLSVAGSPSGGACGLRHAERPQVCPPAQAVARVRETSDHRFVAISPDLFTRLLCIRGAHCKVARHAKQTLDHCNVGMHNSLDLSEPWLRNIITHSRTMSLCCVNTIRNVAPWPNPRSLHVDQSTVEIMPRIARGFTDPSIEQLSSGFLP